MTIHGEHPFVTPEGEREPLRRLRGRMAAPVTVLAAGVGAARTGVTVSSVLIAEGEPPRLLALVGEDSAFWEAEPEVFTVNLLADGHQFLADAFAGTAPAPGGVFRLGEWEDTTWGPVLTGTAGWLGARVDGEPRTAGWGLLVEAVIEQVVVGDAEPLLHLRGRYRR